MVAICSKVGASSFWMASNEVELSRIHGEHARAVDPVRAELAPDAADRLARLATAISPPVAACAPNAGEAVRQPRDVGERLPGADRERGEHGVDLALEALLELGLLLLRALLDLGDDDALAAGGRWLGEVPVLGAVRGGGEIHGGRLRLRGGWSDAAGPVARGGRCQFRPGALHWRPAMDEEGAMNADAKKTTLRMIPYGIYVLTCDDGAGNVGAATVNWVTQASFQPPLVAVGVKADSGAHAVIKEAGAFALNVLGKGQQAMAYTFFKPAERQGSIYKVRACWGLIDGSVAVEARGTSLDDCHERIAGHERDFAARLQVADGGKPYFGGMVFRCNMDGSEFEVLGHNFRNNYEVTVDSFGGLWQSDNDDDGNRGVRINFVMEFGNYGYRDEMTGAGWNTPRTNAEAEIPLRHWHQNDPGVVPNVLQTGAGSPSGLMVYEGSTLPPPFRNHGNHVTSVAQLGRWMGEKAEEAGVYVLPETAAASLLVEEGVVRGVRSAADETSASFGASVVRLCDQHAAQRVVQQHALVRGEVAQLNVQRRAVRFGGIGHHCGERLVARADRQRSLAVLLDEVAHCLDIHHVISITGL